MASLVSQCWVGGTSAETRALGRHLGATADRGRLIILILDKTGTQFSDLVIFHSSLLQPATNHHLSLLQGEDRGTLRAFLPPPKKLKGLPAGLAAAAGVAFTWVPVRTGVGGADLTARLAGTTTRWEPPRARGA